MATDFYSDSGAFFARTANSLRKSDIELPDYVTSYEAEYDESGEVVKSASAEFAAPESSELPIGNRADTYVSAMYSMLPGTPDGARDRIMKRARFFGIDDDINVMLGAFEKMKTAAAESNQPVDNSWSVSHDIAGTEDTIRIAGIGFHQMKQAADKLLDRKFEQDTPLPDRRKIASAIVGEGSRLGFDIDSLPDRFLKTAGMGVSDFDHISAALSCRSTSIFDPKVRRVFEDTVDKIASASDIDDIGDFHRLADTIDAFDRRFGLQKFHGDAFPDAVDTAYRYSIKEARAMTERIVVGDERHLVSDLEDNERAKAAAAAFLGKEDGVEFDIREVASLEGAAAEMFNSAILD